MAGTKEAVKEKQDKAGAAEAKPAEKGAAKANPIAGILQKFPWLVSVAVGAVVALVVYAGVVKPVQKRLGASQARVKAAQAAVPKKLEVLSRKDWIIERSAALDAFFVPSDTSQEKIIAQFLQEIEKLSQGEGLFISNINPVKVEDVGERSHLLSVDLEGAADIIRIKKFMKSVEDSLPSARIDSYSIRTQGPENPELRYRFTVQKLVMLRSTKTATK
jgi:hypothetical protein